MGFGLFSIGISFNFSSVKIPLHLLRTWVMMTESVPLSLLSVVPSHVRGVYLHAVASCLWNSVCPPVSDP